MLNEEADRVVIPASALAEVASRLPLSEGQLMLRIYEYRVMEDVLPIVRSDGISETLTGVQSNGFGVTVVMKR
jgi:hypothetical protein